MPASGSDPPPDRPARATEGDAPRPSPTATPATASSTSGAPAGVRTTARTRPTRPEFLWGPAPRTNLPASPPSEFVAHPFDVGTVSGDPSQTLPYQGFPRRRKPMCGKGFRPADRTAKGTHTAAEVRSGRRPSTKTPSRCGCNYAGRSMPRKGSPYGPAYERARAKLLAAHPVCQWCRQFPATVADHNPPLGFHRHVEGSGCCVLVASCRRCNCGRGRGGWWVANQRRKMAKRGVPIPATWQPATGCSPTCWATTASPPEPSRIW